MLGKKVVQFCDCLKLGYFALNNMITMGLKFDVTYFTGVEDSFLFGGLLKLNAYVLEAG